MAGKTHYCSHTKKAISNKECPQVILSLKCREQIHTCRGCEYGKILIAACPIKVAVPPAVPSLGHFQPQDRSVAKTVPDNQTQHNLRQIARLEEIFLLANSYF